MKHRGKQLLAVLMIGTMTACGSAGGTDTSTSAADTASTNAIAEVSADTGASSGASASSGATGASSGSTSGADSGTSKSKAGTGASGGASASTGTSSGTASTFTTGTGASFDESAATAATAPSSATSKSGAATGATAGASTGASGAGAADASKAPAASGLNAEQMYGKISAAIGLPGMSPVDAFNYYGVSTNLCESIAFYRAMDVMDATTVAVMYVKDEADVPTIISQLENARTLDTNSAEGYNPDAVTVLKASQIGSVGHWVYWIAHANPGGGVAVIQANQ